MRKPAKMTAAAALVLLSGAVGLNCSSKRPDSNAPDGMLSMALTMPSGISISSVSYKIHSNQPTGAPADKTGSINTSNAQATPSVETSYPASTNDVVTLTATTSDGEPCSGSSSEFSVLSGQQSAVMVTLTCGLLTPDGGPGSVRVIGTVVDQSDICPALTGWTVSPLSTGPSGTIDVGSTASDGNASDVLTYKWTASPAPATDPFVNSNAASTTFNCPGSGNFALTITIDDHHTPANCTATRTINVSCGSCGNGAVDPGEDCDSAAAFANNTCNSSTCKTIPTVCGNSLLQPGEQCDSPTAFANNTCDNVTCQNIPIACGNGKVQPGEECEPPGTASCDATCHAISACIVCETSGAACLGVKVTPSSAHGCAGLTGAALTNCQNLHSCLDTHPNCSQPPGGPPVTDPTACFCGTLPAAACAGAEAASIAGQCASAYFAVYGGVNNANRDQILGDFFNRTTAVGMANNLYACDVTKSCFGSCM